MLWISECVSSLLCLSHKAQRACLIGKGTWQKGKNILTECYYIICDIIECILRACPSTRRMKSAISISGAKETLSNEVFL